MLSLLERVAPFGADWQRARRRCQRCAQFALPPLLLTAALLTRFISTHELHRWHHSADPREANANHGSALIVWGRVFASFSERPGRPARIGLFGDGDGWPVRASYWRQLLLPVTPTCSRA